MAKPQQASCHLFACRVNSSSSPITTRSPVTAVMIAATFLVMKNIPDSNQSILLEVCDFEQKKSLLNRIPFGYTPRKNLKWVVPKWERNIS